MIKLPSTDDLGEGRLEIDPVLATSVVSGSKSTHMRTGDPSERQIRGLIGNALGLHSENIMANHHGHWDPPEPISNLSFELLESPSGGFFDDTRWDHKFRRSSSGGPNARTMSSSSVQDGNLCGYGRTVTTRQRQEPEGLWAYRAHGDFHLLRRVQRAFLDPKAALYIGDSDSWIEARLKNLRPTTSSSGTGSPN
ncbi:hypothetical protein [Salinibacter ruber]|uniref:hypothetical protein n=1 Tax=Salinibacter ruber TaxID=146919 RepID=UPI0020738CDB|nr:hypothetical protein [Salinibacter ruber]